MLLNTFTRNRTTYTAILFFSVFRNIGIRVLWIWQISFPRQELSNEHTMNYVRQCWILDLNIGATDLLGTGGGRSSKENRHFWSACFWHDRSRHIYLPAGTAKKYVFGTPQWALTAWKESTTTNLLPPSPHWLLKHNDTHILILILGTESETAASTTEYKVLLRLKKTGLATR